MKLLHTGFASVFVVALSLGAGSALAQTAAPAPTTAPTVKKPVAPRTAASLACSAAADKQSLHGKPRKKFMSDCKHKGGPAT